MSRKVQRPVNCCKRPLQSGHFIHKKDSDLTSADLSLSISLYAEKFFNTTNKTMSIPPFLCKLQLLEQEQTPSETQRPKCYLDTQFFFKFLS